MNLSHSDWKPRQLLFWLLFMALLIASFSLPATAVYWKKLDHAFFRFFNGSLRGNPGWQTFWALANHKLADWLEDICFLTLYIVYVRKARKELRLQKTSELIFMVIYIALVIYLINRVLFRLYWHIHRESPTLVVDGCVRLSEEITWLTVKDDSNKSFPGDHGTTALLFAASYFYFAGWRLGLIAAFYGAFLCLPRLVTGAHWLSDVIVGGGSITILFLSLAFCTPLMRTCSAKIENFLRWCRKKLVPT